MAEPTRNSLSSSIPANYVSIVDLRDRWLKQKQQQQQQQEKKEGSGSGSGGGDGDGHTEPQKQQQQQQQLHHRRQQQQLQSHQPQEDLAPAQAEINGVVEVEKKEEENDRCLGVLPREDYNDDGGKADCANSPQNPTHQRDRLPLPPCFPCWSKPGPQNLRWIPASCLNQPGLLPLLDQKESGGTKASTTTASSVVVSVVPEIATALVLKAEDRRRAVDEAPPEALKGEAEQKNEMKGGKYKKNKNRIREMKRKKKKLWDKEEEKADSSLEEESEEAVEKLEIATTAAAVSKSVPAVAVAFPTNSGVIPKTTRVPADLTPDKYYRGKNNYQEKNKGSDKESATSAVTKSLAVPIKGVSAGNIGFRKGEYRPERIRSGVLGSKSTSVPDDSTTAEIERRLSKLSTGGEEEKTESRNSFMMSSASSAEPVWIKGDRSYGRYYQGRNYTAKQVRETRGVVWVKKGVSPDSSGSYPD